MAIPANISTGRVTGQFVVGVVDGADTDDEPDFIAAKGYISFTASTPYLPNRTATPNPVTMLKTTIRAVLDDEGYLCTPNPQSPSVPGKRGIRLVATNDPDTGVEGWTWNATPSFTDVNGTRLADAIKTFDFALPSGSTVDLTTVVRVPASQGIGVPQAEAAAAAAQDAATKAAADAKAAAADAKAAAGAAKATDSNVSDLVGTDGTETNAAVARQVETAVAPKLDAEEAVRVFQSAATLDAAAAAKVKTANSALREAVDARALAAASTKMDSGQAVDTFATKDELGTSVQEVTSRQVPPLVAQAIAADGTVAAAAGAAVNGALASLDVVTGQDPRMPSNIAQATEVSFSVTDEAGRRSWLEIGADGGPTDNSVQFLRPAMSAPDSLPEFQQYAYSITDEQGRHSDLTIGPDGRFAGFVVDRLAAAVGASYDSLTKSDTSRIAAWGDSITEGGSAGVPWPKLLADSLPGAHANNRGVSGETSGTIAVRQGGIVLTVGACTIPATATPTATLAVTASVTPANLTNRPNIPGTLAGVQGDLKRIGTDWTFTRTTEGKAVTVPAGTPFKPTHAQAHRADVSIFWTGRNDAAFSWPTVVSGVVAATRAMVDHLTPTLKRFLVVSVTTSSIEPSGSTGTRPDVIATNAALKEAFPNNYVDMRRHIIDNGLALAGITPTAEDLAAIAADTLPPSLTADGLHPNAVCREFVTAPKLREELALRGWI